MDQSFSGGDKGVLAPPLPLDHEPAQHPPKRRSAPSSYSSSQNSLTYSVDTTNSNSVVRMSVVLQPSSLSSQGAARRRGSGYVSAVSSSDEEYTIDKSDDDDSDRSSFSLHRMDTSGLLVIGTLPSPPSSTKPKSQMSQKRKDLLRKVSSKNKKNQTKPQSQKTTPQQHPEEDKSTKESSAVSDDSTIQAFRAIDEQQKQTNQRKLSMQVKENSNSNISRRLSSSKHHVNDPSVLSSPKQQPRRNSLGSSLSKLQQSQPPQPPVRGSSVDSPRSLRRKSLSAVLNVDEKDALDGSSSVHSTKSSHFQHTRRPSLGKFFSGESTTNTKQPRRSSAGATSLGSYERRRSRSQQQRKENVDASVSSQQQQPLGKFLSQADDKSSTTKPKRASTASSLGSYERRRSTVERTKKKHMTGDSSASTGSSSRSTVSSSSASTGSASDDTSNQPSMMERLDGVWNSSSSSTTTSRRRRSSTPSKARGRRSLRSASPTVNSSARRLEGRRIRSPHRRNYHSSQSPLRSSSKTRTSSTERVSISALVQQCAIHSLDDGNENETPGPEVSTTSSSHKRADSVSQRSASSTRLSKNSSSAVVVAVDPFANGADQQSQYGSASTSIHQ